MLFQWYFDAQGWVKCFLDAGFSSVSIEKFVVNKQILECWDTDFRSFTPGLHPFTAFLRGIGAEETLKKLVVDLYIRESIPFLNYERRASNPDDFGFAIIRAVK